MKTAEEIVLVCNFHSLSFYESSCITFLRCNICIRCTALTDLESRLSSQVCRGFESFDAIRRFVSICIPVQRCRSIFFTQASSLTNNSKASRESRRKRPGLYIYIMLRLQGLNLELPSSCSECFFIRNLFFLFGIFLFH